jgi:hypothetical protein
VGFSEVFDRSLWISRHAYGKVNSAEAATLMKRRTIAFRGRERFASFWTASIKLAQTSFDLTGAAIARVKPHCNKHR